MKKRFLFLAGLFGFLLFVSPPLGCSGTDAGDMIVHANSVIMNGPASRETCKDALIEILDAALLVLPKTESAAECRSRIEGAKKEFDQKSLFTDKAHQYLSLAYRLVTSGKTWQFPAEISGAYREKDIMEKAKEVGRRLIDSALGDLKAGRSEEAVRSLLEYVLMVITPVESHGSPGGV